MVLIVGVGLCEGFVMDLVVYDGCGYLIDCFVWCKQFDLIVVGVKLFIIFFFCWFDELFFELRFCYSVNIFYQ